MALHCINAGIPLWMPIALLLEGRAIASEPELPSAETEVTIAQAAVGSREHETTGTTGDREVAHEAPIFAHWAILHYAEGAEGRNTFGAGYHRGVVGPFLSYGSVGADVATLVTDDHVQAGELFVRARGGASGLLLLGLGLEVGLGLATNFSDETHPAWAFGLHGIGFGVFEFGLVGKWTIGTARPSWLAENNLTFRLSIPLPGGFPWTGWYPRRRERRTHDGSRP